MGAPLSNADPSSTMGANVFNLRPGRHIKSFSLGEYNLSSTSGTRVYIDLDIPETTKFKDQKIEEREKQQNWRELQSPLPSTDESSDRTSTHQQVASQHRQDRRTPAPPRLSPSKTDPPKTDLVLDPQLIGAAVLAIVLTFPQFVTLSPSICVEAPLTYTQKEEKANARLKLLRTLRRKRRLLDG
uniref:Uncharacterized protein n=1 Tax=Quercus lobata TaxID=97700 RepID=A0A7N2MYA8_QUELO